MEDKKHYRPYKCLACGNTFKYGQPIVTNNETGETHDRCPKCLSWNFVIRDLSIKEYPDGMLAVDYNSPSVGMTLYVAEDMREAKKVINRLKSLKWEVFMDVISDNPAEQIKKYLNGCDSPMGQFV